MPGLFQKIIDNIEAEKIGWCQGEYVEPDDEEIGGKRVGARIKPLNACLVGHVYLASGYHKGFKVELDPFTDTRVVRRVVDESKKPKVEEAVMVLSGLIRPDFAPEDLWDADGVVTNFNDYEDAVETATGKRRTTRRTKAQVIALLRKAAKLHPEV